MGLISDIINAAVSPANKLIECISGALGKIYEPIHIKRMADARAYEINAQALALRENADIPIEYKHGEVSADTKDSEELLKRTQTRLGYQEIRKQQNIESVTQKAYKMLSAESECSDEPVEEDWMIRFFNSVEDISNADMQTLWAKILAGEVKQPKSFSLRTLETLKNLSRNEAVLFEKISKLKMVTGGDTYFPNYQSYWEKNGVLFDELLLLDECGLINMRPDVASVVNISHDKETSFVENENIQIMALSKTKHVKEMGINIYPFTKIGIEISKLFDSNISNENLFLLAKILRGELRDFKFYAYKLTDINHRTNLLD